MGSSDLVSIDHPLDLATGLAGITITRVMISVPSASRGRNSDNRLVRSLLEFRNRDAVPRQPSPAYQSILADMTRPPDDQCDE